MKTRSTTQRSVPFPTPWPWSSCIGLLFCVLVGSTMALVAQDDPPIELPPLIKALQERNVEAALQLLQNQEARQVLDPNSLESAIHVSIGMQLPEVTRQLLEFADVSQLRDRWGRTVLHVAARVSDITAAEAIVAKVPAMIDALDHQDNTPLHVALTFGQAAMVEWLIQHGANVNAANRIGVVPWHLATRHSDQRLRQLLTAAGAEAILQDRTPLGAVPKLPKVDLEAFRPTAVENASINTITEPRSAPDSGASAEARVIPKRSYLGAHLRNLSHPDAAEFGAKVASGVIIIRNAERSPASMAGLLPGDVIQKFDGQPIENMRDFSKKFDQCAPGQVIQLEVLREDQLRTFEVSLMELKLATAPSTMARETSTVADPPSGMQAYEHPQKHFRFHVPEDWQLQRGRRGRLLDERYDTWHDPDRNQQWICSLKSETVTDLVTGLEEFRQQQERALADEGEVYSTFYTLGNQSWIQVSYVDPISEQWLGRFIDWPL